MNLVDKKAQVRRNTIISHWHPNCCHFLHHFRCHNESCTSPGMVRTWHYLWFASIRNIHPSIVFHAFFHCPLSLLLQSFLVCTFPAYVTSHFLTHFWCKPADETALVFLFLSTT